MVSNAFLDSDTGMTRRRVLALAAVTGGASFAGCLDETSSTPGGGDGTNESVGSTGSDDSEGSDSTAGGDAADSKATVDEWMSDGRNYDGIVDETGTDRVTVRVGADSANGPYAYDPAAVRVSPGTTVVWEWVAASGAHNVVEQDGAFESQLYSTGDATFEYTADEPGTYLYYCTPHRELGMKGAVVVES
ncbi:halocyanin domain-containing protein [Haloprofundus salinisoli]|uniref:halocyanin domain-containing protein n=1 Tax=Haloprofundus salinisoli TaxID=2876193 RepID=UPI001CC9B5A5|nr:halocyanin domain-containing protein [Haloprofundus salinisoli]